MFIKKRGKAKAKAAADGKAEEAAAAGGGAVMVNEEDFDHRLGNYQLMEGIGKGGYGTVYRGLNIERGMTVAVKRVNLQGIPHEELESIEVCKLFQRAHCSS
jgi:serine/threonine protein kinase